MDAKGLMNPKKGIKKPQSSRLRQKGGQNGEAGSAALKAKHTPVLENKKERACPPICELQTGGKPFLFCRMCYLRSSSGSSGS